MKLSREVLILMAILLLGVILRGLYLSELTHHLDFAKPSVDALYHDYWARGIVSGDWTPPPLMDDPQIPTTPYFRPPGYTYFMAGVYRITGGSYIGLRIAQMLLGILSALIAFLLGRRFIGPRAGLIFAALMSVYWVFIYFEGELLEPVLLVVLGIWLVYDIGRWTERMTFRHALVSGVILGLFALVRPNVLLFAPAVVAWAYWIASRRHNVHGWMRAVTGLVLGTIVLIAPVTIRNYVVARDFVPISSNTGINLYIGNNELADGRCVGSIPSIGKFETCFDYPQIVANVENETGRRLRHSEVSAWFTSRAIEYIKAEPGRTLGLTWKKSLMFWCPLEIGHNKEDEIERTNSPVLRRIPVNFPLVLGMATVGLGMLGVEVRRRRTPKDGPDAIDRRYEVSVLLLLFIAAYFVSYVPFFAAGRYRLPVVPCLMFFGAYSFDNLITLITTRRLTAALCWTLALVAAYGVARWNPTGYEPDFAKWHYDRAVDYGLAGDNRRAMAEFREALRYRSVFPQALCNIGTALIQEGKADEAIGYIEQALEINPKDPLAHYCMGLALSQQEKYDAAIKEFGIALEVEPRNPITLHELGVALTAGGRTVEARKRFEEALRIDPTFAPAHTSLAILARSEGKIGLAIEHLTEAAKLSPTAQIHYELGSLLASRNRLDEAMEHYRSAIELKPDYAEAHYDLAIALCAKGKYDEAVEHYAAAVKIVPNYVKAHVSYAIALYFKGDYAASWKEVALAQKYGARPDPEFIKALSEKMPQPK